MRVLLAPMEGVLDSLVRELLTEVNDYDPVSYTHLTLPTKLEV